MVSLHFTSPYTPRSNGKTENLNKFLNTSLRKLCQEDNFAWDQVLYRILFGDPPLAIHKLIQPMES